MYIEHINPHFKKYESSNKEKIDIDCRGKGALPTVNPRKGYVKGE
jgi:hypothetical protein